MPVHYIELSTRALKRRLFRTLKKCWSFEVRGSALVRHPETARWERADDVARIYKVEADGIKKELQHRGWYMP